MIEKATKKQPGTRMLAATLEAEITDGRRAPGSRLPSIRELAAEHSTGISSALGAYKLLEKRGLVVREPGRGTFVTNRTAPANTAEPRFYTWEGVFAPEFFTGLLPNVKLEPFHSRFYLNYSGYLDFLHDAAHTAPGAFSLDEGLLPTMEDEGLLRPLDEFVRTAELAAYLKTIPEPVLNAMRHRGRLMAIPVTYCPTLLYFNRRLFRENGLKCPDDDWSWEEFMTALDRLTKVTPDQRIGCYGLGIMLDINGTMPPILQLCGELFDHNGNCVINSAATRAGIELFMHFYCHPGCCTHKFGDPRGILAELLIADRLGMLIGNELDGHLLRERMLPEEWGTSRLPGCNGCHRTTISVRGIGIAPEAPDPAELLRRLAPLLTSPTSHRLFAARIGYPPAGWSEPLPELSRAMADCRPAFQHPSRFAFSMLHEILLLQLWHKMTLSTEQLKEFETRINAALSRNWRE